MQKHEYKLIEQTVNEGPLVIQDVRSNKNLLHVLKSPAKMSMMTRTSALSWVVGDGTLL
jgi:hypothetical protein